MAAKRTSARKSTSSKGKSRGRKTTKRSRKITVGDLVNALHWNCQIAEWVRKVLLSMDPDLAINVNGDVDAGGINIPRIQYCPPA